MKFKILIKSFPFLLTLLLIFFLNISNQKVNTKLRILIWNTPSFSLGNYLAISTGAGFILSYILTSNLAYISRPKFQKSIEYKNNNNEVNNEYSVSNSRTISEKTLIERDFKDPSPTINAQFRVIGNTERYTADYSNNDNKYNYQYDDNTNNEESYIKQHETNNTNNEPPENHNDWNDDSLENW